MRSAVELEAQCDFHRRLDAGAVDLAVSLGGVAVAAGEEGALDEYG